MLVLVLVLRCRYRHSPRTPGLSTKVCPLREPGKIVERDQFVPHLTANACPRILSALRLRMLLLITDTVAPCLCQHCKSLT